MILRSFIFIIIGTMIFSFGCDDDDQSQNEAEGGVMQEEQGGSEPSDEMGLCFTDDECSAGEYCRATDPTASPSGTCEALEAEGGACVFGTQCQTGLVCTKANRAPQGTCLAFPSECTEDPTCMCATNLCARLEGSSCSVGVPDDPASSMTVSCSSELAE